MKNFVIVIAIIMASIIIIAPTFAAGPWKGKIIDIETKEPLEGAVVVAVWYRVWRTPAGGVSNVYEIKEVLTNKEGNFKLLSYTPTNLLPILSYLKGPEFTIFKPGYLSLSNVDFGEFFLKGSKEEPLDRKDISGKTFRLAPGNIELPMLKTRAERRMGSLGPVGEKSDWRKQKEFIKLIRQEWEYITGQPAGDLYKIDGGH